jgi:hypothetical protein
MTEQRFRVGIVGLEPGRGWAARAHVPALRALSDSYEIVGVANTSLASAQRAAAALGLPRAFNDVAGLVSAPEVDIVTVTVKVPHHLEVVKAAIEAGKHVYCEWPLGNGLAEAEELAELAKAKSVLGVVGTQARVSPEIEYLKHLITDGFVGEVLSTTIVARGGGWGGSIAQKKSDAYMLDRAAGATMLTIPVGHTLAALTTCSARSFNCHRCSPHDEAPLSRSIRAKDCQCPPLTKCWSAGFFPVARPFPSITAAAWHGTARLLLGDQRNSRRHSGIRTLRPHSIRAAFPQRSARGRNDVPALGSPCILPY